MTQFARVKHLFAKQKFPARLTTSGTLENIQIRKIRTTVRIWVFTDRLSTNQNREFWKSHIIKVVRAIGP